MEPRLALVCMPWASPRRPSIALGILKSLCDEIGIPAASHFPNLEIVARVGLEVTETLANENSLYGLSEHLFACCLFAPAELKSDAFLDACARVFSASPFVDRIPTSLLKELRDSILPRFLDDLADEVLAAEPTVVGFTSTFNQTMASLALADRLKRRAPALTIVAGGACFDGEMGKEYQRAFPQLIDHVFLGEAEDSFRAFLRSLAANDPVLPPGVTSKTDALSARSMAVEDMNTVPMPDYAPYFDAKRRLESSAQCSIDVDFLLFESSRGCWWGQKQQCVFCGINPDLLGFRQKSVDRVVTEVVEQATRYGVTRFLATDWILQRNGRRELFERLEAAPIDLDLFYEVRADIDKDLLLLMKRAGVNALQPGIESFSTPLLMTMKKATTALRQIQFLRWCREVGIVPHYNLLIGFDGETADHYREVADWLPLVVHLQPPLDNLHRVEIHRFAPLFDDARARSELVNLRADYRANIPAGRVDVTRIGYFYASPPEMYAAEESPEVERLKGTIDLWLRAYRRSPAPHCEYAVGPGFVEVSDGRWREERRSTHRGLARDLLLLCDRAQSLSSLSRDLASKHTDLEQTLAPCLDDLLERGLLLREDDHLLTVPIGRSFRTTEQLRELALGQRGKSS